MNKSLLKTATIAAASLFIFAACEKKHKPRAAAPAKPTQNQTDELQTVFKEFHGKFDSKDQTVALKLEGISLRKDTQQAASINESNSSGFTVSMLVKPMISAIELSTEKVKMSELRSGRILDLPVAASDELTVALEGGQLAASLRCLDADCARVAVWLAIWPAQKSVDSVPKMAGYIFSNKGGEWVVDNSNLGSGVLSVEQALTTRGIH